MALEFAHGVVQWLAADAATTTYVISGLTFQPKALRFSWVGIKNTADALSGSVDARRGVGFVESASSKGCVATMSSDASANADCGSVACNDCVACTVSNAGARDGLLDISSLNSDGFTLIVDDATPVDLTIAWEAWGGSDIANVTVGTITEPAATGNQSYGATGFVAAGTDQVVMFAGVQSTAAVNTGAATHSSLQVGFSSGTASGNNVTVCGMSFDGDALMDTKGYCRTGECLSLIGGTRTVDARAAMTSFGTDVFTLNWAERGATSRKTVYMAIKGGNWSAGSYTIAGNSGGATATVSGLAFAPIGGLLIGRMTAESAGDTASDHDRISMGRFSSTSSRSSMGVLDQDTPTTSNVNTTIQFDQSLSFPSTTATLLAAYDINAMNSDGFQSIVDVAGGVASEWHGFLVFGNVAPDTLWAQSVM